MPRAQAARTRAQRPRSVRAVGASAPIRGPIPAALPRSALLHRSVAPIPAALPRSAFLGTTFALGDRTCRRPTPGARLPSCSSCMAGTACRVGPARRGTVRRSWRRPEVVSCSIDHAPVHVRGGMRRAERAWRPRSRPRVRGMQFLQELRPAVTDAPVGVLRVRVPRCRGGRRTWTADATTVRHMPAASHGVARVRLRQQGGPRAPRLQRHNGASLVTRTAAAAPPGARSPGPGPGRARTARGRPPRAPRSRAGGWPSGCASSPRRGPPAVSATVRA